MVQAATEYPRIELDEEREEQQEALHTMEKVKAKEFHANMLRFFKQSKKVVANERLDALNKVESKILAHYRECDRKVKAELV